MQNRKVREWNPPLLIQLELVRSRKFNASEIREIRKLVENNKELFKQKWDEYFNS